MAGVLHQARWWWMVRWQKLSNVCGIYWTLLFGHVKGLEELMLASVFSAWMFWVCLIAFVCFAFVLLIVCLLHHLKPRNSSMSCPPRKFPEEGSKLMVAAPRCCVTMFLFGACDFTPALPIIDGWLGCFHLLSVYFVSAPDRGCQGLIQ